MEEKHSFGSYTLYAAAAVLLILLDQITKQMAVQALSGGRVIPVIDRVLELLYVENNGAAFGLLQNGHGLFYVITLIVCGGILYTMIRMPKTAHYRPLAWTLTFIFAGAVGNLIDRVSHHYVVDFIYFMPIDWPVFNVADIYVSCGTAVLVLLLIFVYKEKDLEFFNDLSGR